MLLDRQISSLYQATTFQNHPRVHIVCAWGQQQGFCSSQRRYAKRAVVVAFQEGGTDTKLPPGGQGLKNFVLAWNALAAKLPGNSGSIANAELILNALKLSQRALINRQNADSGEGTGLQLAGTLADLQAQGLPVDAEAIAAGILTTAVQSGELSLQEVEQNLGSPVARILQDILKVRALPSRLDLYDDEAAATLRELCFNFYDARAIVVEVVSRLMALRAAVEAPRYARQLAALEALQIYAPLGHALGMRRLTAELEDLCFQEVFPGAYTQTRCWLQQQMGLNEGFLEASERDLNKALQEDELLRNLISDYRIEVRHKSLFSVMKKLLRLEDLSKGGCVPRVLFDLLGMRIILKPRDDLPSAVAEDRAIEACYMVRDIVRRRWQPVLSGPGQTRSKDYISQPKPNGYRSLHETVRIQAATVDPQQGARHDNARASHCVNLEVQIRTQSMHLQAESGESAHAAYKGGLPSSQLARLQAWTQALQQSVSASGTLPGMLTSADAAHELFRHLDRNGDGRISAQEMEQVMRELGMEADVPAAAAQLLSEVAEREGGSVQFSDFLHFTEEMGSVKALPLLDQETVEDLHHLQEQVPSAAVKAGVVIPMQ